MHNDIRDQSAFSLIELLCVIALITALSGWILVNNTQIGSSFNQLSLEEVFRSAVNEARHLARTEGSWIELSWDQVVQDFRFASKDQLFIVDRKMIGLDRLNTLYPIGINLSIQLATSEFDQAKPLEQAVQQLRFYPSGLSSRARIRWHRLDQPSQQVQSFSLDAFSSGPIPKPDSSG